MYRAEIERKDLKSHFKDLSPVTLSNNPELTEGLDLTSVVRLLSLVNREGEAVNQVA